MKTAGHIHILGIGGVFMGSLAQMAVELGFHVTGSDGPLYPPMSDVLSSLGIAVYPEDELPEFEVPPDYVLIGNRCSRGHPAIEALLMRSWSYCSGPDWLRCVVLAGKEVIAVAGTHGKTTTTAALAWILQSLGIDIGFLIGGMCPQLGVTGHVGEEDIFVIEADEYDTAYFDKRPKFMHYHPDILLWNNLEFDHADVYRNLEEIEQQFGYLLRTVSPHGHILASAHDQNIDRVIGERGVWTPVETFGMSLGHWQARSLSADSRQFQVFYQNEHCGNVSWGLCGEHNAMNALAAIAAAVHIGVEVAVACEALSDFQGVRRRMEKKGEVRGVEVYEDFAHHPTAIRHTIKACRARFPSCSLCVVLQFGSQSMARGAFGDAALSDAVEGVDHLVLWQPDQALQDVEGFATGVSPIVCQDQSEVAKAIVVSGMKSGDIVLMMGNSNMTDIEAGVMDGLNSL